VTFRSLSQDATCYYQSNNSNSGVTRGASGGTRPGAQALGAHQHTFCSHLKMHLSRNLDQSMLKNAYFLEKDVKNRRSVGGSAPELPLASGGCWRRSQTPALLLPPYYYNFVKFISSAKCGLLPSKKEQILHFPKF